MIDSPDFFRTQREARIHHAPWADQQHLEHAAGIIAGMFVVVSGALGMLAVCAIALRVLGGEP
jgi:hypothetical protein